MNWKNNITQLLNLDYPIIQAPMFGVSTPEMVTAATKAGCLGSLPLGDLPAERCAELINKTKQLSNHSFAVNIFVNEIPPLTDTLKKQYAKTKAFIEQLALQHNLSIRLPDVDEIKLNSYHEPVDAIIEEGCKVLSFTFGNLDQLTIQKLKNNNIVTIGTCTSVAEAILLEKSGIDIICVQGIEAGGHRGTFAGNYIPQIGGLSLFAKVFEAVKVPLIYAGGLCNGKTVSAAKTLGAKGFQIGSLLLGSMESALKEFEKQKLRNVDESEIVLTKSFSGRYARGIRNAFIEAVENTEYIIPYPYQNKLTSELRRAAKAMGNLDFVSIWLGQSINKYSGRPTDEILRELIEDTENQ
ncbi:MAG: NAD(P)H-dependent flavin oxidoreductase [Flavisolibacter sp.]